MTQYFTRGVEKDKAKPYEYHGTTRIPEVTHDKSDKIPRTETKLVQQTRAEKKHQEQRLKQEKALKPRDNSKASGR